MKAGKKQSVKNLNLKRIKAIKGILAELDDAAYDIIKSKEQVSEDNIEELAEKYMGRKIDKMEKNILLAKLKHFEKVLEDERQKLQQNKSK